VMINDFDLDSAKEFSETDSSFASLLGFFKMTELDAVLVCVGVGHCVL
jgi:hypothetical protein